MHLVADVGNTETVFGLFERGSREVTTHWRVNTGVGRTPDEYRLLLRSFLDEAGVAPAAVDRGVIGSVVPSVTGVLEQALARLVDGPVHVVGGASPLGIRLDVDEPRTVGADRIVNTLAASVMYGKDTIAVDLGTATTFDVITADGAFLGGVIAPGLMVGMEWLGRRTAMLPGVGLAAPEQVIGRRTETCMRSGVFYMAVDGVDGVVDRIRKEWGRPHAYVVGTGGYAAVLGPHSRTIEEVEPYLTLIGLQLAGDRLDRGS